MAQNEKKPLHEVVSLKLGMAPYGVSSASELGSAKAAEVKTLLDVLREGEMPATAAREIYSEHNRLPEILDENGMPEMSDYAQEVLNDLMGRKDKPKN